MSPTGMDRDSSGKFAVLDRSKVKLFKIRDSSFTHVNTIPIEYSPEDVCIMNGYVYLQADHADGIIHKYAISGNYIDSFGEPYKADWWLVRNQLSDGMIACSKDAQAILTMRKYLPFIYAYSPTGKPLWTSKLHAYKQQKMTESYSRGGPGLDFGDGSYDVAKKNGIGSRGVCTNTDWTIHSSFSQRTQALREITYLSSIR